MARYATLALSTSSAERARDLAKHFGKPVGRYVDELIDAAHAATFGDPDAEDVVVEEDDAGRIVGLQLPIGDRSTLTVRIPAASADSVANTILRAAEKGGALVTIDLDVTPMLLVSRKGSGVVVEAGDKGRRGRRTYSPAKAVALAGAIRRAAS